MPPERRAVLVVVDGLRGDLVGETFTPNLHRLAAGARWYPNHRCVFPSATRVNSASLATGCFPASHGLHGNVIALDEGGGPRAGPGRGAGGSASGCAARRGAPCTGPP